MHEIIPYEIEDIDVNIHLAKKQTISQVGIVRDVEVLCGKAFPQELWSCNRLKER